MRLHLHYAVSVLANTYVIAARSGAEAALIDPVVLDVQLFNLIEKNGYAVRYLLFTDPSRVTAHGVQTITKVFDVVVVAPSGTTAPYSSSHVAGGDTLSVAGQEISVIDAHDTSRQGVIYEASGSIFPGSWLGAGIIATANPEEVRTAHRYDLVDALSAYPDETPLFPFYGPPTTLGVERQSSPAFSDYSPAEA